MRRRRAERCLLRAEEALAAGFGDEARNALDEARRLTPSDVPNFDELRARVSQRIASEAAAAARQTNKRRGYLAAATAASVIGVGLLGYGVLDPLEPVGRAPVAPAAHPAVGTPVETKPAPPPAVLIDQMTIQADALPSPVIEPPLSETAMAVRASLSNAPETVGTAGPEPPVPSAVSSAPPVTPGSPPVEAETSVSSPARPAPQPIEPVPASLPEPAPPPAPAPTPPVTVAAAATPEPAESRIRAVLSTYETAFGALDASAVHTVWPSVDGQALARAFEGLASQSISLGRCAIAVQGESATARCTGSAEWTPRVGGGTRNAARSWDFTLQSDGEKWQIVRAVVR